MIDLPLTPAQELYLESFDRFLRAGSNPERLHHRWEMGERLNFVLAEADLELPDVSRWADSWHERALLPKAADDLLAKFEALIAE